MFLTGRCSCRVKNQSPGWDVLLKVDWEAALQKVQQSRAQDIKVVIAPAKPEVVTVTARPQEAEQPRSSKLTHVTIGIAVSLVLLLWLRKRHSSRKKARLLSSTTSPRKEN